MFSSCSKLKQTVTLVEKRVNENRSTNPTRDLDFLGEYYSDKRQWAKAIAASRHALAVAEGYSSSFEVTAADVEYEQSRKSWQWQRLKRDIVQVAALYSILLATVLLLVCAAAQFLNSSSRANSMAEKKSNLDLQIKLHPSNPQAYVNRAWFFLSQFDTRTKADADCKQALSLAPNDSNALQLQVQLNLRDDKYEEAWRANEKSSHTTSSYYRHKSVFERRSGDHAAEARSLETAYQLRKSENESQQGPKFMSYYQIAEEYGKAGQFANSLRCAELEVAESTNWGLTNWDRARVMARKARYLVSLGRNNEAINVANDTLSIQGRIFYYAYAYRAKAYFNLGQYEKAIADASKCLALHDDPSPIWQTKPESSKRRATFWLPLSHLKRCVCATLLAGSMETGKYWRRNCIRQPEILRMLPGVRDHPLGSLHTNFSRPTSIMTQPDCSTLAPRAFLRVASEQIQFMHRGFTRS